MPKGNTSRCSQPAVLTDDDLGPSQARGTCQMAAPLWVSSSSAGSKAKVPPQPPPPRDPRVSLFARAPSRVRARPYRRNHHMAGWPQVPGRVPRRRAPRLRCARHRRRTSPLTAPPPPGGGGGGPGGGGDPSAAAARPRCAGIFRPRSEPPLPPHSLSACALHRNPPWASCARGC